MKIATYNVNGINARLPVLLRWLEMVGPDVVCLQELKASQEKIPAEAIYELGYKAVWHGQKQWNGVAVLSRQGEIEEVNRALPGNSDDPQSRYLEVQIGNIRLVCLYLPNGNPAPGPKFDYKLEWLHDFLKRAEELLKLEIPVILAGDFNVIPTNLDVYKPERWVNDALFRPETRQAYENLLSQGWTDALREIYPNEKIYTYWDYFRNAFARDAGLRIDHFLLNGLLREKLINAGVDKYVRGWEKSSDHAPVWIELKD